MKTNPEELFKTVLQVLAILCLVGIVGVILHKAHADLSTLAREHGHDFWTALTRYVFKNLAGG